MAGTLYPDTRKMMEARGYLIGKVERWLALPPDPVTGKIRHPAGGIRQDLWGIFDAIAVGNGEVIGIQLGAQQSKTDHIKTLKESNEAKLWLEGCPLTIIEHHAWRTLTRKSKTGRDRKIKVRICQVIRWKANMNDEIECFDIDLKGQSLNRTPF